MKNSTITTEDAIKLRKRAEVLLVNKHSKNSVSLSEADILKLLFELEVHQIELEMQNEELQLAKEDAEKNAEKYSNMYDFAPSGYFTLDSEFRICEVNFSGAFILRKERSKLINSNFISFVKEDNRVVFNDFLDKANQAKTKQGCEVELIINENHGIFAHIEGVFLKADNEYLLTVVDIHERRDLEENLNIANESLKSENSYFIGRELKMIELKMEINELLLKAGLEKKYRK